MSQVQFDFSVSVKMIRVSGYFWSLSLQTYQLRALDFGFAAPRALEPVVLVGGVVDDELGDDAQAALLRFQDEAAKVLHRPEVGIDVAVVGDVVAVVAAGRGVERQQPQRGDAEILQIVELVGQPREIADAVIVAVVKRLHMELVDDGVLVPKLVVAASAAGTALAFSLASRRPTPIGGKPPSARSAISAREASTFSAFLFTVMPMPWK